MDLRKDFKCGYCKHYLYSEYSDFLRYMNKEYYNFIKYELSQNYWNEYIMDAYDGYNSDIIFLAGIPDLPKTLPHSLIK